MWYRKNRKCDIEKWKCDIEKMIVCDSPPKMWYRKTKMWYRKNNKNNSAMFVVEKRGKNNGDR